MWKVKKSPSLCRRVGVSARKECKLKNKYCRWRTGHRIASLTISYVIAIDYTCFFFLFLCLTRNRAIARCIRAKKNPSLLLKDRTALTGATPHTLCSHQSIFVDGCVFQLNKCSMSLSAAKAKTTTATTALTSPKRAVTLK